MKALFLIQLSFIGALITGWVFNLMNVLEANIDVVTMELIVQIIGIILVPIGAFMGFYV